MHVREKVLVWFLCLVGWIFSLERDVYIRAAVCGGGGGGGGVEFGLFWSSMKVVNGGGFLAFVQIFCFYSN